MGYTVQSGDSLWKIAQEQCGATGGDIQKTINEIAQLNNIANPNMIFTGTSLKLPGDTFQQSGSTGSTGSAGGSQNNNTAAAASGTPAADGAEGTQDDKFADNNLKIFEDFEKWRKGYKDAMELFEQTGDQEALDEALTSIGGKSYDYNKDSNYQDNLKKIANGMFTSLSDGSGVTYDAFLNWYTQGITSKERAVLEENEDRFKAAFDKLDADNSTKLESDEIENMFEAFDKMDKVVDGMVSNANLTNPDKFTKANMK